MPTRKGTTKDEQGVLKALEEKTNASGGAVKLTPLDLAKKVHKKGLFARYGDILVGRALAALKLSGWHDLNNGSWAYAAASRKPSEVYRRHFREALGHLTEGLGARPFGPISIRDIGDPYDDDAYIVECQGWFGSLCFEELGWRKAHCPRGVHAVDVAWYPPEKI